MGSAYRFGEVVSKVVYCKQNTTVELIKVTCKHCAGWQENYPFEKLSALQRVAIGARNLNRDEGVKV